jgi:hypothetical protein
MVNGYAFLERQSWDNFNGGERRLRDLFALLMSRLFAVKSPL